MQYVSMLQIEYLVYNVDISIWLPKQKSKIAKIATTVSAGDIKFGSKYTLIGSSNKL